MAVFPAVPHRRPRYPARRDRRAEIGDRGRHSDPPAAAPRYAGHPAVGAHVSNLRCVFGGGGASGLGRLGFLATTRGARDGASLVLVGNRHVLLAHGAAAGDEVFQPEVEEHAGALRFPADRLNPVATIENAGHEGNYRFAYPGEPEAEYFIDCATARLRPRPGTNGGGESVFRGVARAHRFDTFAGRELRVRKLGVDAGLTGRVVDVAATVTLADGGLRHNCIAIRSMPARDGAPRHFATAGDSGALVVDELGRAIGLLWGVDLRDPDVAYACHLEPVLHRLKLTPWRRSWGSPPAEERSPIRQRGIRGDSEDG